MKNAQQQIDKQKEKELKRQKGIIIEKLYPILVEQEMNIEQAKIFLQVLGMSVKQAFNNLMLKMLIKELNLSDMLAEGKDKDKFMKALEILGEEKVTVGVGMVNELNNAIDVFVRQENLKRPISDLKTDWIR
jgi:hypothetical protein